jgi:hypothetical protein
VCPLTRDDGLIREPFTSLYGSWLNIAEIELSALTRQCLDRRIDDLTVLNTELTAWQTATNNDQRQVYWHFTTNDARTRLRHSYPERWRRRSTSLNLSRGDLDRARRPPTRFLPAEHRAAFKIEA